MVDVARQIPKKHKNHQVFRRVISPEKPAETYLKTHFKRCPIVFFFCSTDNKIFYY